MKIQTVLIIAVLLCGLCISVSGRSTDISDIEDGDTIFVWETGLDLTGLNESVTIDSLRKYSGDNRDYSLLNIIPVTNPASFDVLDISVDYIMGIYYIYNESSGALPECVIIQKPAPSLNVVLSESHSDEISGESVSPDTNIAFKVMSPRVGSSYKYDSSYPAQAKIEFTTPSGGKTYILGNSDFSQFNVTGVSFYTDTMPGGSATNLEGAESGIYSAIINWETPSGFKDYAKSPAVTFAIRNITLSLTSERTAIASGKHFVTVISGKAYTKYVLYIQNEELSGATHLYPEILLGQPGVDITSASAETIAATGFTDLPRWEGINYFPAMAYVTTKADGTRPIEWMTDASTDNRTFTIKVTEDTTSSPKSDTVLIKVMNRAVTITASGDGSITPGDKITLSGTNTDSNAVYLFITGPGLPVEGAKLDLVSIPCVTGNGDTFRIATVNNGYAWGFSFNTGSMFHRKNVSLSDGIYEIYAVSEPKSKNDLSGAKYGVASFVITGSTSTPTSTQSVTAISTPTITASPTPTDIPVPTVTITQTPTVIPTPTYDAQSEIEALKEKTENLEDKSISLEERLTKQETLVEMIMNFINSLFG